VQVQLCKEMDSGNPGVALDLQIPLANAFYWSAKSNISNTASCRRNTGRHILHYSYFGCVFPMKIVMSVRGKLLDLREGC
jgi:hypothetical protein